MRASGAKLLLTVAEFLGTTYPALIASEDLPDLAGIVRPADIDGANTIPYERIAEARISYGGRGRITEVQQPTWGKQLVDAISPI